MDHLVTTPEKLDLLIRHGHPAVADLALVVADEAHNIRDESRGPRLELLLGTIKREQGDVRFLLLSPFLPNDGQLVRWLGEERALPPIKVDWQPARKLVGGVQATGRRPRRVLVFEPLIAADNRGVAEGTEIPIWRGTEVPSNNTISALTKATVQSLGDR